MEINFSAMRNASEELHVSATKINRLVDTIECGIRLVERQEGLDDIVPSLKRISNQLDEEKMKLQKMSSVIDNVCEKYEQTETQVKYSQIFLGYVVNVARFTTLYKLDANTSFPYSDLFEKNEV